MYRKLLMFASLALVFASVAMFVQPRIASANPPGGGAKITICHRDNNVKKPYGPGAIEVDEHSANGFGNGDHFLEHTGPIAYSEAYAQTLKTAHQNWGDIIPPIANVHNGLNWTDLGQAMWNYDCQFVTFVTPAAVTFVDPTCDTDGSYTIPTTTGVKYYIDDAVVAAGTYPITEDMTVTVTAKADTGYFIESSTTHMWTHEFTIPTAEECVQGAKVVTPAAVTFTPPTCSVLGFYTIPTVTGVAYKVNDVVVAVGGHAVANGSTVTVTATPIQGYDLKEGATNQWTYTFTAPTNCGDNGSVLGASTTLPNTSGGSTMTSMTILSVVAGFITMLGFAARSIFTRQI